MTKLLCVVVPTYVRGYYNLSLLWLFLSYQLLITKPPRALFLHLISRTSDVTTRIPLPTPRHPTHLGFILPPGLQPVSTVRPPHALSFLAFLRLRPIPDAFVLPHLMPL